MSRWCSDATAGTRTRRRRERALNIGAVLGVLCIITASVTISLGVTPLIFRSGSMAPTIHTGALGLARSVPADQLRVGDIVSVVDSSEVRITHRVVGVEPGVDGGSASIRLRGDANDSQDPTPYLITQADRVFLHVDYLGYVVAWLSNPVAIFLGGILAGGLMVIAFGRTRAPAPGGPTREGGRSDHG